MPEQQIHNFDNIKELLTHSFKRCKDIGAGVCTDYALLARKIDQEYK